MRTPDGIECPYFFGDYYRGRNKEECRLLKDAPSSQKWDPSLCKTCPVPSITRANACPNLALSAEVKRFLGIFSRRVEVKAFCRLSNTSVAEPHIGCGQCHPLPPEFSGKVK